MFYTKRELALLERKKSYDINIKPINRVTAVAKPFCAGYTRFSRAWVCDSSGLVARTRRELYGTAAGASFSS